MLVKRVTAIALMVTVVMTTFNYSNVTADNSTKNRIKSKEKIIKSEAEVSMLSNSNVTADKSTKNRIKAKEKIYKSEADVSMLRNSNVAADKSTKNKNKSKEKTSNSKKDALKVISEIKTVIGSGVDSLKDVRKKQSILADDVSPSSFAFESNSLPVDPKLNPSVGNGHVATNVYRSSVLLNNLYNGEGGTNHRARIPSHHSSNFYAVEGNCSDVIRRNYRLDIQNGTFEETMFLSGGLFRYRTFAHQFYNRVLVTTVSIERTSYTEANRSNNKNNFAFNNEYYSAEGPLCDGEISVGRIAKGERTSKDLKMQNALQYIYSNVCSNNKTCWKQSGTVSEAESASFPLSPVTLLWMEMPDFFSLPSNVVYDQWTFAYSIDQDEDVAVKHFNKVLDLIDQGREEELLKNHTSTFRRIWDQGDIDLQGDLQLQKIIRGCLYYLYTSLPSESTYTPPNSFGGLSPGGLPNGEDGKDYLGHVFWDMDTWMFPPLLLLRTEMGRQMVEYRMRRFEPAAERAESGGYRGIRYPWESAYTGNDVTPDECVPCRENEQHVTGDVALAARQFLSVTMDTAWLTTPQFLDPSNVSGLDYLVALGDFWASRPTYNPTKGKYDINGVMPPDEYRESINNSIYTNVAAAYAIHSAAFAACIAGASIPDVDKWINISRDLYFSYNSAKRYHEEFEGYDAETGNAGSKSVKQADVVMLGFPWQWQMPRDVKSRDLSSYENVTDPNGPAMTWSMFSIGWLDLDQLDRANRLFEKGYKAYVSQPFKVWTEVRTGTGAVNFLTGMGGFLQNLIFGYGGVRIFENRLFFQRPVLPPGTTNLTFKHLDYLGASFDYGFNSTHSTFEVVSSRAYQLTLKTSTSEEYEFLPGSRFTFSLQNLTLYSEQIDQLGCDLKPPIIDVNYDQ